MKNRILEILGNNHENPIEFTEVNDYSEIYGLYTYRSDVFVFKEGEDLSFDDLSEKEQNKVTNIVESKKWKVNKSLQ